MAKGYLYILSNKTHPSWLKIGYTESSPEERARQLSTTAVAFPFDVERYWLTEDVEACERRIHEELAKHRVSEDREFFDISLGEAVAAIHRIIPNLSAVAQPTPQRTLLNARSEYVEGFNRLLDLAARELRIFDPDLSELGMNELGRIETLTRFLRASRTRSIYIALHDVGHVTKHCPRLITLLGSYTGGMFIYQTHGEAAKVQDCFVLADDRHLVRRPVRSQPRGVLVLNDPKDCQPLRERFDEIWESSLPGVSANTTGL